MSLSNKLNIKSIRSFISLKLDLVFLLNILVIRWEDSSLLNKL